MIQAPRGSYGWELGELSQRKKEKPLSPGVVGGRQARGDVCAGKFNFLSIIVFGRFWHVFFS